VLKYFREITKSSRLHEALIVCRAHEMLQHACKVGFIVRIDEKRAVIPWKLPEGELKALLKKISLTDPNYARRIRRAVAQARREGFT
jgi:hypothetical protein